MWCVVSMNPIILAVLVNLPLILSQDIQHGSSDPNLAKKLAKNDTIHPVIPARNVTSYVVEKNATTNLTESITKAVPHNFEGSSMNLEEGAIVRGVWVFVGISLLFMLYIGFQTYRKRGLRPVIIKKYGIKTRRTDVEMEPLPLDEDEDDETLFDLGNLRAHR